MSDPIAVTIETTELPLLTPQELRQLVWKALTAIFILSGFVVLAAHVPVLDGLWKWVAIALDLPLIFLVATFLAIKAGLFGWKTALAFWLCLANLTFAIIYYHAMLIRFIPYDERMEVSIMFRAFLVFCLYHSMKEMITLRGGLASMWERRRGFRWPDHQPHWSMLVAFSLLCIMFLVAIFATVFWILGWYPSLILEVIRQAVNAFYDWASEVAKGATINV